MLINYATNSETSVYKSVQIAVLIIFIISGAGFGKKYCRSVSRHRHLMNLFPLPSDRLPGVIYSRDVAEVYCSDNFPFYEIGVIGIICIRFHGLSRIRELRAFA